METFDCDICRKRVPVQFKHDHHVRPQAAGGTDVDIIRICAGCHNNIHRLENLLAGPKAGTAKDVAAVFYDNDPGAQQRALRFAAEAAKWMHAKRAGHLGTDQDEIVDLMVEIPAVVKKVLAQMGADARDPRTGKRLGVAGAARQILINHVIQKFPPLRADIERALAANRAPKTAGPSRDTMRSLRDKDSSNVETRKTPESK